MEPVSLDDVMENEPFCTFASEGVVGLEFIAPLEGAMLLYGLEETDLASFCVILKFEADFRLVGVVLDASNLSAFSTEAGTYDFCSFE